MRESTSSAQARAKALFKREERLRDGQKAMVEYEAAQRAVREKTARLRALRLARDAAAHTGEKGTSVTPSQSVTLLGSLCSAAASVNGIQGEGVISTLKRVTLNCNETNHWLDAIVDSAAHRGSDARGPRQAAVEVV